MPYYRSLSRGRLVILGSPGAGKTVTCIRLLLDLVDEATQRIRAADPAKIPVRFNLPSFDPPEGAEGVSLDLEFDRWLSAQIADTYGINHKVAAALVSERIILPILDGLDEMDTPGRPSRAFNVVRILNSHFGSQPVIIACRTNDYYSMVSQLDDVSDAPAIQDATAVVIDPLTAEQIVDYIRYRFPSEDFRGEVAIRWEPITKFVRTYPESILSRTLRRPLWLFLAVTAYRPFRSTPAELIDLSPVDFNNRLMSQLVPSVVSFQLVGRRKRYDARVIMRFLHLLAEAIRRQRTNGASSDIAITALWRLVGNGIPVSFASAIYFAATIDSVLLGMCGSRYLPNTIPRDGLLLVGVCAALVLAPVAYVRSRRAASRDSTHAASQPLLKTSTEPADPELSSSGARRVLIVLAVVLALLVLLCSGVISFLLRQQAGETPGPSDPTLPMLLLIAFISSGVLSLIAIATAHSDDAFIALPSRTIASLRRSAFVPPVIAVLSVCMVSLFIGALWLDTRTSIEFALFYMAPIAMAAGLCISAGSPWLTLLVGQALLLRSRATPDSLSRFLEGCGAEGPATPGSPPPVHSTRPHSPLSAGQ